ncbi:DUF433 domain-containing protein [Microbacterium petrolearium]|jgi:uncharacterized protein (DUF433 family)
MDGLERITFDRDVAHGRATIRGTRVRVSDVLALLAAGVTADEIVEDYPYLEPADVSAVLAFAAAEADHPVLLAG